MSLLFASSQWCICFHSCFHSAYLCFNYLLSPAFFHFVFTTGNTLVNCTSFFSTLMSAAGPIFFVSSYILVPDILHPRQFIPLSQAAFSCFQSDHHWPLLLQIRPFSTYLANALHVLSKALLVLGATSHQQYLYDLFFFTAPLRLMSSLSSGLAADC